MNVCTMSYIDLNSRFLQFYLKINRAVKYLGSYDQKWRASSNGGDKLILIKVTNASSIQSDARPAELGYTHYG